MEYNNGPKMSAAPAHSGSSHGARHNPPSHTKAKQRPESKLKTRNRDFGLIEEFRETSSITADLEAARGQDEE